MVETAGIRMWTHVLAHSKRPYFHCKALTYCYLHMLQWLSEITYMEGIWKLESALRIYAITKL